MTNLSDNTQERARELGFSTPTGENLSVGILGDHLGAKAKNSVQDDPILDNYIDKFKAMTDEQLIEAFNHEVGNTGWVGARALYIAALHQAFHEHGFDYSAIGDEHGLSFSQKVRLEGQKVIIA